MNVIHYIGLDVHKKTISYCIKTADGRIVREGKIQALRSTLRDYMQTCRACQIWKDELDVMGFRAWRETP
jgi:hypothetical protein